MQLTHYTKPVFVFLPHCTNLEVTGVNFRIQTVKVVLISSTKGAWGFWLDATFFFFWKKNSLAWIHEWPFTRLAVSAVMHFHQHDLRPRCSSTFIHMPVTYMPIGHQTSSKFERSSIKPSGCNVLTARCIAWVKTMQPSCSHRKNTETSWLPFRGQSVSGNATVCNALFNIMHNHSLPYLGPLYSSLLHLLEKESCTLNVSQKKKVQTWPSVITKKRQSMTTECDSSGCSCVYVCGLE